MIAALLGLSLVTPAITVFASPLGSDSAAGTVEAPVKSFSSALERVRAMRNSPAEHATIEFASGDYPLHDPVRLTSTDSNLTIHGANGSRLLGGKILAKWSPLQDPALRMRLPEQARSHVLVCDVSDDPLLNTEKPGDSIDGLDLVFDHVPLQLARWPQSDKFALTGRVKGASFQFNSDETSKWASSDIWALGYWNHDYIQELNRIDLSESGTVAIQGKLDSGVMENRRFYFLNVLEELNSPGDFYFDRPSHRILLYPPAPIDGHEIMVEEGRSPLLSLKDCSNVTFNHLSLEGGRAYAGSVDGGDHIHFVDCSIRSFGGSGLTFRNSIQSGLSQCELSGLGGYGVWLEAGDRKLLSPGGDSVEDCHIFNYARWHRTYQPAINLLGVGNRASHNEIRDAPHNAILMSGNDHTVEYNDIRHVCTEAGDAGAIYCGRDPSYQGLIVRNNRFRDIAPSYSRPREFLDIVSVYLDDRLCGATVERNIFEGPGMGVLIGGGRDNAVRNNLFVGKTIAVRVDQRGKSWAAGKPSELFVQKATEALGWSSAYAQRYPGLASMLNDDPAAAKNDDVSLNVCVGAAETFLHLEDGLLPDRVGNHDNVVVAAGTLQDAEAQEPHGFIPILMAEIGPRSSHP